MNSRRVKVFLTKKGCGDYETTSDSDGAIRCLLIFRLVPSRFQNMRGAEMG